MSALQVQAHIDSSAIAYNLARIRQRLGSSRPRIWATVKADAYGHGIARVMPGLAEADGLAVYHLPDAHQCYAAGWRGPILVHGGLRDRSETNLLGIPGLHLVISRAEQLDWLHAAKPGHAPSIWLRYAGDTHLGGFDDQDYAQAHARCADWQKQGLLENIGLMNHYRRAEDADGIAEADARFRRLVAGLPGPISSCNSAALLQHPEHAAQTDWVRPGRLIYGVSPMADITDGPSLGLRPAMQLTARILSVQTLQAGASVGYKTVDFTACEPTRVGLVACGYCHGYPRSAGTGTPVMAAGKVTRLLGHVTMDVMAVDLTGIEAAGPGSDVLLWGDPRITVEAVAASAGTLSAALLTALTPRVAWTTEPVAAGVLGR